MPKLVHKLPEIRHHISSGRARIRLNGKTHWLGQYGSPESIQRYHQLVAVYLENKLTCSNQGVILSPLVKPVGSVPDTLGKPPHQLRQERPSRGAAVAPVAVPKIAPVAAQTASRPVPSGVAGKGSRPITVGDLITRFSAWSERYYRDAEGAETREHGNFLHVLQPLKKMFGATPAAEFGPSRLIEFREELIRRQLARRTINRMIGRVRMVFRWSVSRELIDVATLSRLQTLEPLAVNRGGKETSGARGSVPWEVVEKTLPFLPPLIQSFVTVAFFSGCRVGELSRLTTAMVDRSDSSVWIASLDRHKTRHHGKSRKIYFGPQAQQHLLQWLTPEDPDQVIFSPLRSDERQQKRTGKRLPGQVYSRNGLNQCLKRAIKRAGVASWSLAQLRYSAAVRITNSCDLETTRQVLGHSSLSMSQHYAQDADQAAREAAKTIG
jgi:integrase